MLRQEYNFLEDRLMWVGTERGCRWYSEGVWPNCSWKQRAHPYGSENVFLGRSAGEKNVNGYFNASLGNYAGPTLSNLQNASAIGYRASVSASNSLVLGSINGVNGATATIKLSGTGWSWRRLGIGPPD
jgi:hypothetical protein